MVAWGWSGIVLPQTKKAGREATDGSGGKRNFPCGKCKYRRAVAYLEDAEIWRMWQVVTRGLVELHELVARDAEWHYRHGLCCSMKANLGTR